MKSHVKSFMVVLVVFASVGFCQLQATAPVADANAVTVPSFPYMAEINGDDVYIRSGPGTNYYNSGKAKKGDKVKVVSRQFSWSCIIPPVGSFSWIYIPYVTIDPDSPGTGIVTGDNVRVYAGSDLVKPIHSTLQLKLDRGEKVKLLGEQKDNYYKIAPPTGAYLWVSTKFATPVVKGAASVVVVDANAVGANVPADVNDVVKVDVNEPTVIKVVIPEPPKPSMEVKLFAEYKDLQKKILAERVKPLAEQDYSGIRKGLDAIKANKEAGKVAGYCGLVLKQVDRYELAGTVLKQLALQNKQLESTLGKITRARETRMKQVKPIGRFAVVGTLKSSYAYSSESHLKHYRVVNDKNETICYARPAVGSTDAAAEKLIGKKVGLVGKISPHLQTRGALVKFTEIERAK